MVTKLYSIIEIEKKINLNNEALNILKTVIFYYYLYYFNKNKLY